MQMFTGEGFANAARQSLCPLRQGKAHLCHGPRCSATPPRSATTRSTVRPCRTTPVQRQYTNELLFSTLVDLLSRVILKQEPSVYAAYRTLEQQIPVSDQ